jgi:hypothetical protein
MRLEMRLPFSRISCRLMKLDSGGTPFLLESNQGARRSVAARVLSFLRRRRIAVIKASKYPAEVLNQFGKLKTRLSPVICRKLGSEYPL